MSDGTRSVLGLSIADVAEMSPERLPALLTALAALQAGVAARLAIALPASCLPQHQPGRNRDAERWLTVAQVAERLGRDKRWVYRRAQGWPFTVKDGRALAFSERGLSAWMERHQVQDGA